MHPKLKQNMTKNAVFCSCDCLYASQSVNLNADTCIGSIAPDKAAYCVFTQFRGPENAIKFISVRTKTQQKSLILNSELFRSV